MSDIYSYPSQRNKLDYLIILSRSLHLDNREIYILLTVYRSFIHMLHDISPDDLSYLPQYEIQGLKESEDFHSGRVVE